MISTSWGAPTLCSTEQCGSPPCSELLGVDFVPEKNALVLKHMSNLFEFSEAQPTLANHMIVHIKLKNTASYTSYGVFKMFSNQK